MKERIEKAIRDLWNKIYFEQGRFDSQYSALGAYLKDKKLGSAAVTIRKCKKLLDAIDEALGAIGVLEGLLEEHEGED